MFRLPALLRPTSARAFVISCLVAAAPALLSVALAVRARSIVSDAWSMQAWPVVQATLQKVDLETPAQRGNERATATYAYTVDGRQYSGSRVSLYGGDNIGGFQRRIYDDLKGRLARQEPVPVHVDPHDPRRSILLPVLRWEILGLYVLAVLVFGVVAASIVAVSYRSYAGLSTDAACAVDAPPSRSSGEDDENEEARAPGWAKEKAEPRLAWGRRLMLVGAVLLAADFWLTDISRFRSSNVLERWLAEQMVATGEIRVSSIADDRVRAAFIAAQAATPGESTLGMTQTAAHGLSYEVQVVVSRADEPKAVPQLEAVLAAFKAQFGPNPPQDLFTYAPKAALPLKTEELAARWQAIAVALLLVGGLLLGAGYWLAST